MALFSDNNKCTLSAIQEQFFRDKYDKDQLIFVRAGLLIAFFSYALYALSDNLAAPSNESALSIFRFAFICPILGIFFILSWFPSYIQKGQAVYALQMAVMGYLHLILISLLSPEDPGFNSYYGGLILIICGLGILGGLRTKYASITALLILFGYQVVAIFVHDMLQDRSTLGTYVINNLFLLTAVSFSILTSFLLESYSRNNFMQASKLNETVSALTDSERKLKATLKEQVEWSSLFTRFIRHELSNSVTGAATSLQLIARKSDHEETLVYVSRAEKCLQDLRELLNKASEATSIDDAFQVSNQEPVNLNELLEELVSQFKDLNDKAVIFEHECVLEIKGSFMLLTQLFRNLLDNAVRHAGEGHPVKLSIKANNTVVVENEGDPLPEHPEKLFELGKSSRSGKSGLFGLGLYVVKKIVVAHGGTITANPLQEKEGARFTVTFPSKTLKPINIS